MPEKIKEYERNVQPEKLQEPEQNQGLFAKWKAWLAEKPQQQKRDLDSVYRPAYSAKPAADERSVDSVYRPPFTMKPAADDKATEAVRLPQSNVNPGRPAPPDVRLERVAIDGYVASVPQIQKDKDGTPTLTFEVGANGLLVDGVRKSTDVEKWHTVTLKGPDIKEHASLQVGDPVALTAERVHVLRPGVGGTEKVSQLIDPNLAATEKPVGIMVVAKGTVCREPELKVAADGREYARVLIRADSISGKGVEWPSQWQTGVFWGKAARDVLQVAKLGKEVEISGALTKVSWRVGYKQHESSEIRNPLCRVLEKESAKAPVLNKHREFELGR